MKPPPRKTPEPPRPPSAAPEPPPGSPAEPPPPPPPPPGSLEATPAEIARSREALAEHRPAAELDAPREREMLLERLRQRGLNEEVSGRLRESIRSASE
jgi:hypothetical protein